MGCQGLGLRCFRASGSVTLGLRAYSSCGLRVAPVNGARCDSPSHVGLVKVGLHYCLRVGVRVTTSPVCVYECVYVLLVDPVTILWCVF